MAATNSRSTTHGANSESFERNFQRLQEVVQKLSEGNLTLQEALSSFEEGMALTEACTRMLDEAELRVKQVSERAMRAGQAAAAELDGKVRPIDQAIAEPELLTFEIESFESALIFDAPQEKRKSARTTKSSEPETPRHDKSFLDPLFDEDD